MNLDKSQPIIYQWIGDRIDVYCSQYCGVTRNFIQHCILQGAIQVNDHKVKKSYRLCPGDKICIWDLYRFANRWYLQECAYCDLPIKLQTPDYVVIYKPKGILSHPTSIWDIGKSSVVGFLVHHFGKIPSVGPMIRAGLVHRLDKMTDGLMICAISERGLRHFTNLFRQKSQADTILQKHSVRLHKYYRATCRSTTIWKKRIQNLQTPHLIQSPVYAQVPGDRQWKIGMTMILSCVPHVDDVGLRDMDIELLTGRTHQIRYHLSQAGLPIVWDYLYGTDDNCDLALTAYRLDFVDPDGYDRVMQI